MWDIRLKTPFNFILYGPTMSGKTTFIKNLLTLRNQIFTQPPQRVFMIYKMHQDIYDQMKESGLVDELVHVKDVMPTLDQLNDMMEPYKEGGSLFIFDDTMSDINSDFQQLFCNSTHHHNCSIIFVTQVLKLNDDVYRIMSKNTQYMTLMSNARDDSDISMLSTQYRKNNRLFLYESYLHATKNKPYSYLLIDYCQNSPPTTRVLARIFPHEFPVRAYFENI